MKRTLSVIVPALNEEENIRSTVDTICAAIYHRFSDYEILVFDDASTDSTGVIADELSRQSEKVKVIHNNKTMGFGYNYRKGVELAKNDYIVMFPGDNEISGDSMSRMFALIGKADIIIPYTVNTNVRPLSRRIISRSFTTLINVLFNLRVRYYNGPVIHRKEMIRSIPMTTDGYAYQAEILTRLIRSGCSYVEVGMRLQEREHGTTKAFALKNIVSVLKTVINLATQIYLRKNEDTLHR